jgi:hypothetical protein
MLRFLIKIVSFLLPIFLLLYAYPTIIFVMGREAYTVGQVVATQMKHPSAVVGKEFSDLASDFYYKQTLVAQKKPQVISIGSSRTFEFRKEFFTSNTNFVNAGFGAANVQQVTSFIQSLPQADEPKVMLLGLDHRGYKPEYEFLVPQEPATAADIIANFISFDWREIYLEQYEHKIAPGVLWQRASSSNDMGITALIKGDGFRSDGSYRYGYELESPDRYVFLKEDADRALTQLRENRNSFEYSSSTSVIGLQSLDRALAAAKARHIQVIGFLPPYEAPLYDQMLAVHDEYREEMVRLPKQLDAIFKQYGFAFYDFSDVRSMGGGPGEFTNNNHPTDKLDLRMLIAMAQENSQLRQFVPIEHDRELLSSTQNDFLPLDTF